jgi:RNA ligase (TIGR02306 family)
MKLASIENIQSIEPHPYADRLEIATVLCWQAIVRKGDFKTGDRCVFIVIDTILPDAPWSEFLKDGDKPIRLRTIKLRGVYSQGLVLPVSVLPEHVRGWQVGADVGGELGVKKYVKEIPAQLSGIAKGAFPTHLAPKTDEDNGLSYPDLVKRVLSYPCVATAKLDGSSMTVIIEGGKITHVCSRNLSLEETEGNAFWIAARKLNLEGIDNLIIQGELMGPGIQGNQLELESPEIYIYQMRPIGDPHWMTYTPLWLKAASIGANTCPQVLSPFMGLPLEELQKVADELKLGNGKPVEGIVVRPVHSITAGHGRPLGFKIINRNYGE